MGIDAPKVEVFNPFYHRNFKKISPDTKVAYFGEMVDPIKAGIVSNERFAGCYNIGNGTITVYDEKGTPYIAKSTDKALVAEVEARFKHNSGIFTPSASTLGI